MDQAVRDDLCLRVGQDAGGQQMTHVRRRGIDRTLVKWGQGAAIAFILFAIIIVFSPFQRFVMRDRKTLPRRRRVATWEGN
jgi:hypothetical protein